MQQLHEYLPEQFCDVLIIGSGAAGLSLALRLTPHCQVTLVSKGALADSATYHAQGGIAAVFDEKDTIQSHCQDTLIAGAGLCDHACVEFVTSNARHCIDWLIAQGAIFDSEQPPSPPGRLHLTREGGHSHRRILHAADTTGRMIINTLISRVHTQNTLCILENFSAIDLVTSQLSMGTDTPREQVRVTGATLWNNQKQQVEMVYAKIVVLATGGSSSIYRYNTNPNGASGDGIAIAWRVGCRVANLEFNQFHPTTLYHPQAPNFLLTEALRGEGAFLHLPDGRRFMLEIDARAELAPRDIVARTMHQEMQRLAVPCLYLNISHKPVTFTRRHFPALYKKLLELDLDLTQHSIPVVPAAHYSCGGVVVDHYGRSDVTGLYAIGEVSYTGLHGANRLASNSLLECLVYGYSASIHILQQLPQMGLIKQLPTWKNAQKPTDALNTLFFSQLQTLRNLMWQKVGLVRTTTGLQQGLQQINLLKSDVDNYYANTTPSDALLALRNGVQVAQLIVRCALARYESRGGHWTQDYPQQLTDSTPTVLA